GRHQPRRPPARAGVRPGRRAPRGPRRPRGRARRAARRTARTAGGAGSGGPSRRAHGAGRHVRHGGRRMSAVAVAAATAPAGGLRRAWAAESLKREARGVRPAVAGAFVLGLLMAVLVTGLAAVTGGTVPSEGAGLPYTVGGFGEPAGASAVARFLAPQVAVLAVFLIAPSAGRDLRSRLAQVQLSTGLAPRQAGGQLHLEIGR